MLSRPNFTQANDIFSPANIPFPITFSPHFPRTRAKATCPHRALRMGALVSTAAQTAANALPSLATLRAAAGVTFEGPVARRASPAGSASPSYDDVLDVLDSLQQLRLPPELAIAVLDQASVPARALPRCSCLA